MRIKGGEVMKILISVVAMVIAVMFVGSVFAVAPSKTVEWDGGGAGKVVFDGKVHASAGLKCNDCHTKIFPMKKGTKMTMEEMNAGKFCGTCHNGEKAFSTSKPDDCAKCHKK
jgi:c(7)-type cytochrome triheme protein